MDAVNGMRKYAVSVDATVVLLIWLEWAVEKYLFNDSRPIYFRQIYSIVFLVGSLCLEKIALALCAKIAIFCLAVHVAYAPGFVASHCNKTSEKSSTRGIVLAISYHQCRR